MLNIKKERLENSIHKVVSKLISLSDIDGSEYTELTLEEQQKIGYFSRDFGMGHWDWPQGVGLYGLSQLDGKYEKYIKQWADTEITKGLPVPNINTICPLLTLMEYPEYETLCLDWVQEIMNKFNRTQEGGFQHDTTGPISSDTLTENEEQIWADTIFMTVLFLAKMGRKYNNQLWLDEATYQVMLHIKYLFNPEKHLFYHGWDFTSNDNFGANFWCRGNSWLTMGIPLFIDYMDDSLDEGIRRYLIGVYQNQVSKLVTLRDSETGLWHTLLDDPESYLETSGSAGIIAGMYTGLNKGYIEEEKYLTICEESIAALTKTIESDGTVQGVSAGTCISNNREDYKNIIIKPMAYGQAMMLCALVQTLKYPGE